MTTAAKKPKRKRSRKPGPGVVTRLEAVEQLGCDERTLRRWQTHPSFPTRADGLFDVEEIRQWRILFGKKGVHGTEIEELQLRIQREVFRRKQLERRRLQRQEDLALGNQLPRDEYEIFLSELIICFRDAVYRAPKACAMFVPAEARGQYLVEIDRVMRDILAHTARQIEQGPDIPETDE